MKFFESCVYYGNLKKALKLDIKKYLGKNSKDNKGEFEYFKYINYLNFEMP
jgi:hypothetical protein